MTDRLSLYNGALRAAGCRRLATLSDDTENRYILDEIWDDGWVKACLEQGQWNHAMRTVGLTYSPSVEPPFGLRYAFDKPDDLVRVAALCQDEWFQQPIIQLQDDANFWFCDLQTIYVRYVSIDQAYGLDFSLWPQTFVKYVEHYGALQAVPRLKDSDTDEQKLEKKTYRLLVDALAKDAQKESPKFPPMGNWNRSRLQGGPSTRRPPYR